MNRTPIVILISILGVLALGAMHEALPASSASPADYRSAPIYYDGSYLDSPKINLDLLNETQMFLLDTGAAPSFLFLRKTGFNSASLAQFQSVAADSYSNIPLEGIFQGATMASANGIPAPPFPDFEHLEGLFSPQSVTRGVKVIDMLGKELLYFPNAPTFDVVKFMEHRYQHPFHAARWFGREIKPVPALFVMGRVDRGPLGLLDIDTGSFQTKYQFPDSALPDTEPGRRSADISGSEITTTRTLKALPIFIESYRAGDTKVTLTSSEQVEDHRVIGTIGADILKSCIIIIPDASEELLYWYCSQDEISGK